MASIPGKQSEVSRAEYLKKYLSRSARTDEGKRKKKKEREKHKAGGLRLVEEDAFLPTPAHGKRDPRSSDSEDELLLLQQQKQSHKDSAQSKFKADSFVFLDSEDKSSREKKESRNRRNKNDSDDSDQSVTRRRAGSSGSNSDLSPERRPGRATESSDESPPRRPTRPARGIRADHEIKKEVDSGDEKRDRKRSHDREKTNDGRRAGLVTIREMREETNRIRDEEAKKMSTMEDAASGRYAETRRRQSGFHRPGKDTKETEERKMREAAKQEELEKKYKVWNKGVAQLKQRAEKLEEMEETMKEGFSRYADDEAMNKHLKEKLQDDDPMADYIRTKRHKVQMREGLVYPTYKGHWPQNRFGIPPGYRWDGVNRSNGFEEKMALAENKKRAQDEIAYRSIMECSED